MLKNASLFFFIIFAIGIVKINAVNTSPQYIVNNDTLVCYTDVTGHNPSAKYTIRVRSAATNNEWVNVFTHYTNNRAFELPDINQADGNNNSTNVQHYPLFTSAWSQSYGNIEMSRNQAVEVEIAPKNGFTIVGQPFTKAAVHPAQKVSNVRVIGGKVYFTMSNPTQVAIDINGQMDDNNAQINPLKLNGQNVPMHTICFFANPILKKPSLNGGSRMKYVPAGTDSITIRSWNPATYDTLCFMPGVHPIGRNFKIYPGKKYYIPGDAIIFGTLNNVDVSAGSYTKSGEQIRIYGYGTISTAKVQHPLYVSTTENGNLYKPICIENGLKYEVFGITIDDPSNHSCFTPSGLQGAIRWGKINAWRANGDGFAFSDIVEDCFMRTSDDASYCRGKYKARLTFWKDHFSAIFYMARINNEPLLIEDCDVIYCRSRYNDGTSGGLFNCRGNSEQPAGQNPVQLTFRNIRVHDKIANMCIFNMKSYNSGTPTAPASPGGSYDGILFQNISVAGIPSSTKQVLYGSEDSPWAGGLKFDNVTLGGTLITQQNFDNYFLTNQWVSDLEFTTLITIKNNTETNGIKFYQNTLGGKLNYNSSEIKISKIELIDLSGRTVHASTVSQQQGEVDLTGISSGLYIVKCTSKGANYATKIMIK